MLKVKLIAALLPVLATASPLYADQYKQTADGGAIDCIVSKRELTRVSLIGDQFASVSKISTGYPYNDFAVTNEPVRGDIYLSVPDTYAAATISFFATTKKGFVYKFSCRAEPVDAQQIFITNPALAKSDASDWEAETPRGEAAVRLIQAMANNQIVPGYIIRQASAPPSRIGDLEVQLIAEYRGSGLVGKVIRLTNKSAETLNITESDIAPRDSVAVSLAASTLKAGASTTAYLVGANGETSHD
nr:type-F conjugative transfer system secretin TraK [uncultured Sphingorhabdus sp.]